MAKTTSSKESSSKSPTKALMAKFKSKTKVISRVRKEKAPAGYMKDEELLELFALKPGKGVTVKTRLVKAEVKEINDQIVFELKFTVVEGPKAGTPIQKPFWLDPEAEDEDFEKAFKDVCFALQKMGYDTDNLEPSDLEQIAEELTEEKPHCVLYVSCYKVKTGKNKGQERFSVRINSSYDPEDSDSEEEDEDDEEEDDSSEDDEDSDDEDTEDEDDSEGEDQEDDSEEDDEQEEEVKPSRGKKTSTKTSTKSGSQSKTSASKKVEEPEEDEDENDESEDDEDNFDENDPTTWVGYSAKIKPAGIKKPVIAEITKYNTKTKKLTAKDKDGGLHTLVAEEVVDWV